MKTFAVIIDTVPDYVERRQPFREAHVERLRRLRDEGKVTLGGAWADPIDGALLVCEGESAAAVQQMMEDDIYFQHGLWSRVLVREWNVTIK